MSRQQRPPHAHDQRPRWHVEGERTNRRAWKSIKIVGGVVAAMMIIGGIGSAFEDSEPAEAADPTPAATSAADEPLYKGTPSEEWRENLKTQGRLVLADLREVNKGLGRDSDLTDVLSTCDDIERGLSAAQRVSNAQTRFQYALSDGRGTGPLSAADAKAIIGIARTYVCPA